MAYLHFTLSDIKSKFQVAVELATDVFAAVPPQDLSPFLAETLQENVPLALAVSTGSTWNFLNLAEHTISVDAHEYSIENPGKILGILWHMVNHT